MKHVHITSIQTNNENVTCTHYPLSSFFNMYERFAPDVDSTGYLLAPTTPLKALYRIIFSQPIFFLNQSQCIHSFAKNKNTS